MMVNESKTCLCLFYHKDTTPIEITLNNVKIKSETKINVLGVIFDQKLQWSDHIAHCIAKSNKALSAIRLIKKYFNTNELLAFVTSNFYSILFYNSEIWHLPSLKNSLEQKLLSSLAKAIEVCVKYSTRDVSFIDLHAMYLSYKMAISLYRHYNSENYSLEWVSLNYNQIITSRQTKFISSKAHIKRVGINALANRFYILNNTIPFFWLNLSYITFKLKCKSQFLLY